jgi:hypothetical protein
VVLLVVDQLVDQLVDMVLLRQEEDKGQVKQTELVEYSTK